MEHGPRPARISRRAALWRGLRATAAAALVAPLAACEVLGADDPTEGGLSVLGTATPTPSPTETIVPTASPGASATAEAVPASPPEVALDPTAIGQGETALLTVTQRGAVAGSAQLLGQRVPLIAGAGDALWCVVGAGLLEPLGSATAVIVTRDARGTVLAQVDHPFEVVAVARPVDYLNASPEVTAVLTPEAAEIEAALRAYEQFNLFEARPRWDGTIRIPVDEYVLTTAFGQGRSINGGPVTGQHSGTDLAAPAGTPIHAAAAGRVAWAGAMPIRGNSVLIDHGAGVVTGYHHLLEFSVTVGQMVEAGEEIAKMGSTGFSTGPHLHWEMTIYGVNVDPMTWTARTFAPGGVNSR
ncbi:MAG: M23 family metallopeptidase [Dehalococcoidia bacterium]